MWNAETIGALVEGLMIIVRRHFAQTGEILTDDQAKAMLLAELQAGQSAIALWFAEKGLPLPE